MADDLPLTHEDVEEIISILENSAYESLDLQTGRYRLRLARTGEGWTQEWSSPGAAAVALEPAAEAKVEATGADGLSVIKPPLPGTFYRAPQPGAPPFVEVGSKVEPDTVVAIIETMKLMTPVHAGLSGEIVAILPENAEAVDAESVLMQVKPA